MKTALTIALLSILLGAYAALDRHTPNDAACHMRGYIDGVNDTTSAFKDEHDAPH